MVVVVSAPGDMTDDLIARASQITSEPDGRELDMLLATGEQVSIALLCMAIKNHEVDAISLTGPQAGIRADHVHTKARIVDIEPRKILNELAKRKVVVVAGFQGLNLKDDVTTLGRGGSDLTAVALAAALKSEVCEIYTDVLGVYTTDPRVVPEAQKIEQISYDEMLELAGSGSQVMQARSIEVAKKFGVTIHVRSSLERKKGTLITKVQPRDGSAGGDRYRLRRKRSEAFHHRRPRPPRHRRHRVRRAGGGQYQRGHDHPVVRDRTA